jgi:hypothetical protein
MAPTGISSTETSVFERCHRQGYLKYYLGIQPADPSPTGTANFGIRWHTAMECFYGLGLDLNRVLDHLYAADIAAYPDYEPELRKDWDMARIMADGYPEWVAAEGKDANLEVVTVEQEVRVPLPGFEGIVDLRAKMDMVVRNTETGLLSFLDHKTGDFKRHDLLAMDQQMLRYSLIQWLASGQPVPEIGFPQELRDDVPLVNGGIVRTARRVKRTANARPPFYDQAEFRFDQEQMASHLATTQATVAEILAARQRLDQAGGDPRALQRVQLTALRPNKMLRDCDWSCPFSKGLCQLMDSGTAWMDALVGTGRYVQADPYSYYDRPGAREIAAQLAPVG